MSDAEKIRIGTRGSPLALAQAAAVERALHRGAPGRPTERVEVRTTGDRRLDLLLSREEPGSLPRGLFTKELEEALLDRRVDLAVHSLKDLPTALPPGLRLGAVLPRADADDVLLTRNGCPFAALPRGAVVATSSERRRRALLWKRRDLEVVPVRGNLGTRLERLASEDGWAGMVLARAGLQRLGWLDPSGCHVVVGGGFAVESLGEWMVPAPGQGAIGIEVREADPGVREVVERVNDAATWSCVVAERAFLAAVGGGCQHPVGAHARVRDGTGTLLLRACVFGEGPEPMRGELEGGIGGPEELAFELHRRLYVSS